MTSQDAACVVLRLAAPVMSWGANSQFSRRATAFEPTKGAVLGLVAAALGRRRDQPVADLLRLRLGVRVDQPGSLLRDFHIVSDYRGGRLPSASVDAAGRQRPAKGKATYVTVRLYLQDAVFVAVIGGAGEDLMPVASALRAPAFPLYLGRRSCVPTQPILLAPQTDQRSCLGGGPARDSGVTGAMLWPGTVEDVISQVPWQASWHEVGRRLRRDPDAAAELATTVDDDTGDQVRNDVPSSFALARRTFSSRRVRTGTVLVCPQAVATGRDATGVGRA